jgi:histone deacetylase 6
VPARLATKQELLSVHTQDHLHRLQLFCSGQVPPSAIPSDTYINQHTLQCAALAAGSAAEVAVRVWRGEGPCGAAIIRPPGHHAESNTAMGFCFFNNAAVAARAVQDAGAERVLILDWDVHHGNGTQHIFEHDDSVLYMSLHRYDRCVCRHNCCTWNVCWCAGFELGSSWVGWPSSKRGLARATAAA